jgi:Spy/CpxP family protein refolding chaperone
MKHKILKSTLALTVATLLIAGSAIAQQERNGRDGHGKHQGRHDAETRVAHMTRELDLTDEQSAQLLLVMQAADVEREALHQKIMEQMAPELCDLQLSTEADIASILTPDQLADLEARKEGRDEKPGKKHRGRFSELDCTAYE